MSRHINTHAMARGIPIGDRIASMKREAKGQQKKPPITARERWDCGNAEHRHTTRASALACIDGVLK